MFFDFLIRKKRIKSHTVNMPADEFLQVMKYVDSRYTGIEEYNLTVASVNGFTEESAEESAEDSAEKLCDEPMLTAPPMPTAPPMQSFSYSAPKPLAAKSKGRSLSECVEKIERQSIVTFGEYLQQLINRKGMTNKEVYFESNLTKQYFSKLINNKVSSPAKEKLLCIAVALKLNMDETNDFLLHAGYAISPYSKTDLVFEYFIKAGKYDIYEISYTLEEMGIEGGLWPELAV